MVRIQVKREGNEEQQFLYDCPSTSGINDIAKDVAEICNLQIKIQLLVLALEQRLLSLCSDSKSALPLTRALSEAKAYASKEQVLHDRPLSVHVLRDHIQTIETEAMSNQLPGFSYSSEVQQLVSSSELEFLQEDNTQLWWAGKELTRDKKLCDYVGKNEKTKIICRLRSRCSGPACNFGSGDKFQQLDASIKVDQRKEQKLCPLE